MDGRTALAVLGLAPGATKQQVKTAFRALVKEVHPDASGVNSADQADFLRLHTAYERACIEAPVHAPTVEPAATRPAPAKSAWITSPIATTAETIDITDVLGSVYAGRRPLVPTGVVRSGAEAEFAALLDAELSRA